MKVTRYLKQVIVVRKDLSMPTGKIAAMAAHAAMTFLLSRVPFSGSPPPWPVKALSKDQWRWLTELDDGIEHTGQVSMAKIVCAADSEEHLLEVERQALAGALECHRVIDSGYSHNKPGTLVCIAVGPDWPENLAPVTGALKVYR